MLQGFIALRALIGPLLHRQKTQSFVRKVIKRQRERMTRLSAEGENRAK
jgi:hypothetical protein